MAEVEASRSIDTGRLSLFLDIDVPDLQAILDSANEGLVFLLQQVLAKALEYDKISNAKEVLEVDYNQAVHTSDFKVRTLNEQLQKSVNEAQELRTKLNGLESEKSSSSSEMSVLRSANITLEETISRQKSRIETLETSHKDTLNLLERKSGDISRNEEDYRQLQAKYHEARRELSNTENTLQEAQGQISTLTYREQSLQQEAEFLRKDNERLTAELSTKGSDFTNYRREKSAHISQLQSELEETSATSNTQAEQLRALKRRFDHTSSELDSALAKIADLNNQLTTQEETYRNEVSSQVRLAELWERSCKETQERNKDLENQLDRAQERSSEEIAQWQARVQEEESHVKDAEKRIKELEAQIERLHATIEANAAVPLSPVGLNGNSSAAPVPFNRAQLSPSSLSGMFSPSAQTLEKRGRMSLTQLYTELHAARQAEAVQRRRADKLQEEYDQYREEAERWAPEYQHTIQEFEHQKEDLAQMSINLQTAVNEKEEAERQLKLLKNGMMDKERETHLYQQQARDLRRQVQHLVRELHERELGLNSDITEEENRAMQEMDDAYDAGLDITDTDKIISERLTIFRNIVELQKQNEDLRRVTRKLGAQMERDEKEYQSNIENLESDALNEATKVIDQLKDELKSMRTKMDSYIRERDMFRRMASGKVPPETSDGQPVAPQSPLAKSTEEQANVISELQHRFDTYRNEATVDQRSLNNQIRQLTNERAEAVISANKYKSQMGLANERYKILQGNMEMVKQESDELRKRVQKMHEEQAKLDVKIQQAAEELVDTRGFVESLRTENANLKAEKTLFKSIEKRLQSDNEALLNERARLNNLMSNLQSMQNERERQENEFRRRSLQETERLEKEVQELKGKLAEESEETKRMSERRVYEVQELQQRIDKLNAELASTKEQLAAATTARDQLQARVEEQGILLKSSEEKFIALSRPGSSQDMNHEQQLGIEVAELRKTLELTKAELRDAKEYAEKMKEISATAEEALQDMNATHDKFKETIDQQLVEKDAEIERLNDQLDIINNELQTSNKELSQIHQVEDGRRHALEQENKDLQTEIARLKDVEEKAQSAQQFHQEDLREQARITQEAQRNYEQELLKHAEAAKTVQQLREEINRLRTEARTLRTEAETATATLQSSESSWETQKADYERELREVRNRANDLVKQNNILHQQFEYVTMQAQQIRQRSEADFNTVEGVVPSEDTSIGKEDSIEGLREVIKYLRREKEIVDIKYELLQQENRRLKQQLDRTVKELDETRVQLMSEREKEANAATSSAQHQELLAKINELNVLRESNVTLRAESERNTRRATELEAKVSELTSQISPLEEKLRLLQAEVESKDDQTRLLTEDNERWKNRNQQILQKYERIDPVELQNLRDQLIAVSVEKEKLEAQLLEANNKNRAVAEAWKARHDKAVASAKARLDQNRETIESLEAKITEAAKESAERVSQLERVRAEAESAEQELNRQLVMLHSQLDESRANASVVISDGSSWQTEKQALEESIKQKDDEIARISNLARGAERAKVFVDINIANEQRDHAAKLAAVEEELQKLREQSGQAPVGEANTDQDFEQRVNEEVQRRLLSDTSQQMDSNQQRLAHAEQDIELAITKAVRANQEAADARLAEVIAAKDKELTEIHNASGQVDVDTRIAEAIQKREVELKEIHEREVKEAADAAFKRFKQPSTEKILAAGIKYGEKLFNERWEKFMQEQAPAGGVSQEAIDRAVEEALKKKEEEYAERLQKATEGAKNEAEMRSKLQVGKLQKQVADTKAKLESYEKQFGSLPSSGEAASQQASMQTEQVTVPTPQLTQPQQGTSVFQKLQAGRGVGIPRGRGGVQGLGRGGVQGLGRGGGQGQGRGQRLSGQHHPQQQGQSQGQRPAVNRPVPAGSPAAPGQQGQQRRQSGQQQAQQSQLPRPTATLNAAASPFQPGVKRTRDDEPQGGQAAGQKRTRIANNSENVGNDGQS